MFDFFCFTHQHNARKKPCQCSTIFYLFFFLFFLPWNQAISSLKSGGIQFKERCDVISMWHRDQSIHNLLPCLAFLLWSRKVAVSLLIRHKGYLLASGPVINSPITLRTSNTSELYFFGGFFLHSSKNVPGLALECVTQRMHFAPGTWGLRQSL